MNEKDLASIIREQESGINARERERYMPAAFSVLMRKESVWMTLDFVITGFTPYYVAPFPSFVYPLMSSLGLMCGLMIGVLGFVIGVCAAIHKF